MDNLKGLMEAHAKANKLAREIKKTRGDIINAFKNKDSTHSSDLYILKLKYSGFAVTLNKETAIFDELLDKLDQESDFIDNSNYNDTNSEVNDNCDAVDDSSSTVSEKPALDDYNDNNNISVINTYICNNNDEEVKIETNTPNTPITEEKEIYIPELFNGSVPINEDLAIDKTQIKKELPSPVKVEPAKQPNPSKAKPVKKLKKKNKKDYPSLGKNKSVSNKKKMADWKSGGTISAVKSGYKYGGKGFKVFTNYRNKCKPIYSSTMLYCEETCNGNEKELRNYLIKFGKFNNDMIKNIIFKTRGYYERYALIKVRGEVKYIKKKIKTLNKAKGNKYHNVIHIFQRKKVTISSWNEICNVLYVKNFDILRKDSHKRFTKLFSKYGELVKDIQMGMDKSYDPYAIVHFRDVNGAKICVEEELVFDGKVLNVSFSKF